PRGEPAERLALPGPRVGARRPGVRLQPPAARSTRLSSAQLKEVEKALAREPARRAMPPICETLDRVTPVIESVTGVTYHLRHVWKVLRALGWSRQRRLSRLP